MAAISISDQLISSITKLTDLNAGTTEAILALVERDPSFLLLLSEMKELLSEEDDDFRPTTYALHKAFHLIIETALQMQATQASFPYGFPYGDGEQGIRIEWENPPRDVRLRIPAQETAREYIYHKEGQQHDIEEPASPDSLSRWLGWLIGT